MPFRLNAAVYQSWWDNRQVSQSRSLCADARGCPPGTPTIQNAAENSGEAILRGLEAELTVLPVPDLEIAANFSWNYGRNKEFPDQLINGFDGDPLILYRNTKGELAKIHGAEIPEYKYAVRASWTLPLNSDWGEVVATAHYYRQSTVGDNKGQVVQHSYGLLNYRVDWNNAFGSDIGFSFWMRNALDQFYNSAEFAFGDALIANQIIPSDPRYYGLEIYYEF